MGHTAEARPPIRVNAVAPGKINTERVQRLPQEPERTSDVHTRDEVAGRRDDRAAVRGRHGPAHLRHRQRVGRTFPGPLTGRWRFVLAGRPLTDWLVATPSSPQELR